jgi:hypothetical protein
MTTCQLAGCHGYETTRWSSAPTPEAVDLKKEKNFFETRVIEYQNGGALGWE